MTLPLLRNRRSLTTTLAPSRNLVTVAIILVAVSFPFPIVSYIFYAKRMTEVADGLPPQVGVALDYSVSFFLASCILLTSSLILRRRLLSTASSVQMRIEALQVLGERPPAHFVRFAVETRDLLTRTGDTATAERLHSALVRAVLP
jgi:hypothetical protein